MTAQPNDLRILIYINENGPQRFSDLIDNKELKLSRNTIAKYIKQLRNDGHIEIRYENINKLNELTVKGKIRVEKHFGKEDIKHKLKAYHLFEQQIKEKRDKFLTLFGDIPNSILMDCVENVLDFEKMKFTSRLPSEDFKYHLAFFISRFDIQYAKSDTWKNLQPIVIQLTQKNFIKQFKLDDVELKYFCQEWSKIRYHYDILDEDDNIWYFSSTSILYEILMTEIANRARRGSLQEILFDNFIFNPGDEAINILDDGIKSMQLDLDLRQKTGFISFINSMLDYFLGERKGYKRPWDNLPVNNDTLLTMALDYEIELNNISEETVRSSEIMRTLHYIYAKLNNLKEAFYWGEEFIKANPDDNSIPMIMAFMYYKEKRYDDFLRIVELIREKFSYNFYVLEMLVDYYIEVNENLDEAMVVVEEIEKILLRNSNLMGHYPEVLTNKAKIYFKKDIINQAMNYAEQAWYQYDARSLVLYDIIVEIYKQKEEWELLEDFCHNSYLENEYNPELFPALYFAYLKRGSNIKADNLYRRVKKHYPDYINSFAIIKREFANKKMD